MAHDPPVNSTHLRSLAFLETAGAIERLEDGTSSTFPVSSAAKTVLDRPTVGAMLSTLGGASLDAPLFPEGISVDGNLQFNSGYGSVATAYGCRAWVHFNGTGTVAIRASGNVSSITDNGVGDYTINFINAMPDTNYCVMGQGGGNVVSGIASTAAVVMVHGMGVSPYLQAPTVNGFRIVTPSTLSNYGTAVDIAWVNLSVFR